MDDYDEKFEELSTIKNQLVPTFESTEAISKHLLDVDVYDSPAVNLDSARANLNAAELRFVRATGSLLLEIMEAEEMCGWELNILRKKHMGKLGVTNVTSKAKDGWVSVLSKTNKQVNVQELNQLSETVAQNFDDHKEPGLLGRFFKKKVPGT
jgi:hypothetical protein